MAPYIYICVCVCVCVCGHFFLYKSCISPLLELKRKRRARAEIERNWEKEEQKMKSKTIQMVLSEEQHQQFVKEKKCILCYEMHNQAPRQFKDKEDIKNHNKKAHKNLKVVLTCGQCNQAFTTKADLRLHQQLMGKLGKRH